jgi:predicted dithiol-disulfide oxidoreductase (DUF899 family)
MVMSLPRIANRDEWLVADLPWYSSFGTEFNYDFGVTIDEAVAPATYHFRSRADHEARGTDLFRVATAV